ncbi:MAG: hypothetical protein M1822_005425 [Bathelium mastoideum]|nr:MAG: hypothetical protein M1822_005425 [Bathelium mastoideum]
MPCWSGRVGGAWLWASSVLVPSIIIITTTTAAHLQLTSRRGSGHVASLQLPAARLIPFVHCPLFSGALYSLLLPALYSPSLTALFPSRPELALPTILISTFPLSSHVQGLIGPALLQAELAEPTDRTSLGHPSPSAPDHPDAPNPSQPSPIPVISAPAHQPERSAPGTEAAPDGFAELPQKRRRRASSSSASSASDQHDPGGRSSTHPKRRRVTAVPTMRPDHDPSKTTTPSRPFSNRSSNGSSNGTALSPTLKTSPSNYTNGSHEKSESNGYTNGVGRPTGSFFGHDREEVTRILIQSLQDLGYHASAQKLSKESGRELEGPSVAAFRNAILEGDWAEAEAFLMGSTEQISSEASRAVHPTGNGASNGLATRLDASGSGQSEGLAQISGLVLSENATRDELLFLLRQQKYLELLESRDLGAALMVLRQELAPYGSNTSRLHALSSLMMCESAVDLRSQAQWDGSEGQSRSQLLSDLSKSISPSVMIPEHRLAILFDQIKDHQIAQCKYHNTAESPSLYVDHACSRDEFPLVTAHILKTQQDEIWSLQFSHDGTMLATASKDSTVLIYETISFKVLHTMVDHSEGGVGYICWSPDDTKLTGHCLFELPEFTEPVTTAAWSPDGQSLILGSMGIDMPISIWNMKGERIHKWYKDTGHEIRVHDIAITPDGARLFAIVSDDSIFVFDFWNRNQIAHWSMGVRMTCINVSSDGRHVLVNMKDDRVVMLDVDTGAIVQTFPGQKQSTYMIRSCFGGADEGLIASGSEDSKVYIWRRRSGDLIERLEGHEKLAGPDSTGFVNAVAWHPHDPSIFASAGDDHTVRIWTSPEALATRSQFKASSDPWRPWQGQSYNGALSR